ncbi:MAG: SdrD B-like domain-containing protein [Thermoguttaceae bacterium]
MEPRQLLSVLPFIAPPDINLGIFTEDQYSAYVSDYAPAGQDAGNIFQVAWNGGANDTALSELTINLRAGLFFDINAADGIGAGLSHQLKILDGNDLIDLSNVSYNSTFTSITFVFKDGAFTADKTLRFHIDIDENLPSTGDTPDETVSGPEISGDAIAGGGTTFVASFKSNDFANASLTGTFLNKFAFNTSIADALPPDKGEVGDDNSHMTAGAQGAVKLVAKPSTISGFVYEDRNNNGDKETGEAGIGGVTLSLERWDGTKYVATGLTETTNEFGHYEFANIPSMTRYRIVETQPADYLNGTNAVGTLGGIVVGDTISEIDVDANSTGVNYNFGELKPSNISGTVYEDNNNDGEQQTGELGIAGVKIELQFHDGAGWITEDTKITGANGKYTFTNLDPSKTYRIAETQPANYISGKNTAGNLGGTASDADDTIDGIMVGYYKSGTDYNFGELKPSSLAGTVYEDDNSTGVQDSGEVGIGNVALTLQKQNGDGSWSFVAGTTTTASGAYLFQGLDPRLTYRIVETQPANYATTKNAAGDAAVQKGVADNVADLIAGIKTSIGQDATGYNFGERYHRASISGTVYEDKNENGTIEAGEGEGGIANVMLTLQKLNADGSWSQVATTKTNSDGNYTFSDVDPRLTYRIVEAPQPASYKTTHNTAGNAAVNAGVKSDADDWITQIKLAPLQDATGYNFGELRILGSLSGTVYEDADNNGEIDSGEKRLEGVRVELCIFNAATGKFESTGIFTSTDANGNYSFDGLVPGTYCVTRATTPDGYCDGKETLGDHGGTVSTTDPRMFNITVVGDEASVNYNFGLGLQGSISGYVFVDPNGNGHKDTGENGIAGVNVTLYVLKEDGTYAKTTKTATTDADGFYKFTELCPFKTYAVFETQPDAYDDDADYVGTIGGATVGNNPSNDFLAGIVLPNGGTGVEYNFTETEKSVPLPVPPTPPYIPPVTPPVTPFVPVAPTIPYAAFAAAGFAALPPMLSLTSPMMNAFGGGGVAPTDVSWHLSILNGGHPRQIDGSSEQSLASSQSAKDVKYVSVAWDATPMEEMVWYTRDKSGRVVKKGSFGASGAKPVVADFNGDGIDELAVFQNGQWFIDINGNGVWDGDDIWCELGSATDQPVAGDWDGDGKLDIGTFGSQWAGDSAAIPHDPGLPSDLNNLVGGRPKSVLTSAQPVGERAVKHSRDGGVRVDWIDHVFRYGGQGDVAVTGDWSGDGITKIGVYRSGKWQLDYNGDGRFDENDIQVTVEHIAGAIPVTGDFNGDGKTNIGLFHDGEWLLDTDGDFVFDTSVIFGQAGDTPTTGDFSGNGISELAVLRPRLADALFTRMDDSPTMSEAAPRVAAQFVPEGTSDDAATLHQGRTMHTPFTNVPLGVQ